MSQFNDLLKRSTQEKEPQRLLFLFAKSSSLLKNGQNKYHSGTIDPVMCVDKLPSELTSFSDLTDEADGHSKNWNFIFVSSLSGINGQIPSSDDATFYLKKMTNMLLTGGDLSQFIVWNREEQEIIIS